MDKSALEARKVELEQSFESLQKQKDDIIKQMTQLQGAHSLCIEFLEKIEEKPDVTKPRRAKKSA